MISPNGPARNNEERLVWFLKYYVYLHYLLKQNTEAFFVCKFRIRVDEAKEQNITSINR